MKPTTSQNPAHIFIGQPDELTSNTIAFLQSVFCDTACATCTTCKQIARKQHHATIWITPDNQYTLEKLSTVFSTLSFSLDAEEECFFILEHADFLTPVCANALLKPLEEPPPGYRFILLAQRQEQILTTIRSRCIIKHFKAKDSKKDNPLLEHFTNIHTTNAPQFLSDLEKAKPNERMSNEWIDELLQFWITAYKQACTKRDARSQAQSSHLITTLHKAYKRSIMPGSAKFFWKNLFLQTRMPDK